MVFTSVLIKIVSMAVTDSSLSLSYIFFRRSEGYSIFPPIRLLLSLFFPNLKWVFLLDLSPALIPTLLVPVARIDIIDKPKRI